MLSRAVRNACVTIELTADVEDSPGKANNEAEVPVRQFEKFVRVLLVVLLENEGSPSAGRVALSDLVDLVPESPET
jgi:hypothetical protein